MVKILYTASRTERVSDRLTVLTDPAHHPYRVEFLRYEEDGAVIEYMQFQGGQPSSTI